MPPAGTYVADCQPGLCDQLTVTPLFGLLSHKLKKTTVIANIARLISNREENLFLIVFVDSEYGK